MQLRQVLQAAIVRYQAERGPFAEAAASEPAQLRSILREILAAVDLEHGIENGTQLQTAKVFVVALQQLLLQVAPATLADSLQGASRDQRDGNFPLGLGVAMSSRRGSKGKGGGTKSKRRTARKGLTKREQRAFDELAKGGLVGLGAVDPSPQRTTVAVAACISLMLL